MKASAQLFNLFTVLVIGMTAMACLCAGVTFANPQIFFNPLKPHDDALPLLVPTEPTSTPVTPPVSFPTVPPVGTATPAATVTADAPATRRDTHLSNPEYRTPNSDVMFVFSCFQYSIVIQ